jgi:hypothetical protein
MSDAKELDENEAKQVQQRGDYRGFGRAGAGMPTSEVCCRHGMSSATFYKWKSKFVGLEVSDARRLRTLEQENSRLK